MTTQASGSSSSNFLPPPVTPEQMALGLTPANLKTAIVVRSMPEEKRILEARYRCTCGDRLVQAGSHMVEVSGRHLHLLAFACPTPDCGTQGGIIFDITAAVALLPPEKDSEQVTVDEERRAAELAAYYLLDKAPSARSDASINTLVAGIHALGVAPIGALRYSLRDVDAHVVSLAARCLAEIGDATDVRRLKAIQAAQATVPFIARSISHLEVRVRQLAREDEEVWRPTASL